MQSKRYGWSKFIIMVPSIAIREGVYKSLQITADHFTESYGKKARFFIYNSKRLHELESFSSDAGINVMVINIQRVGRGELRLRYSPPKRRLKIGWSLLKPQRFSGLSRSRRAARPDPTAL